MRTKKIKMSSAELAQIVVKVKDTLLLLDNAFWFQNFILSAQHIFEWSIWSKPVHDKTYNKTCVTKRDSD